MCEFKLTWFKSHAYTSIYCTLILVCSVLQEYTSTSITVQNIRTYVYVYSENGNCVVYAVQVQMKFTVQMYSIHGFVNNN